MYKKIQLPLIKLRIVAIIELIIAIQVVTSTYIFQRVFQSLVLVSNSKDIGVVVSNKQRGILYKTLKRETDINIIELKLIKYYILSISRY